MFNLKKCVLKNFNLKKISQTEYQTSSIGIQDIIDNKDRVESLRDLVENNNLPENLQSLKGLFYTTIPITQEIQNVLIQSKDIRVLRDLSSNPSITQEIQNILAQVKDIDVLQPLTSNPSITQETQNILVQSKNPHVLYGLSNNPSLSENLQSLKGLFDPTIPITPEIQNILVQSNHKYIVQHLSENPSITQEIQNILFRNSIFIIEATRNYFYAIDGIEVLKSLSNNPSLSENLQSLKGLFDPMIPITPEIQNLLIQSNDERVLRDLSSNPSITQETQNILASCVDLERVLQNLSSNPSITQETQNILVQSNNVGVLRNLSRNLSLIKVIAIQLLDKDMDYFAYFQNPEFRTIDFIKEAYQQNYKFGILFKNEKQYGGYRQLAIKDLSLEVLSKYKNDIDKTDINIQYIIDKIKQKNLFLYLNESINCQNYEEIIHSKLGWAINNSELLEQDNVGKFLVVLKDQEDPVKYLRLRKEYFEKNRIWENNLKKLNDYASQVKMAEIFTKIQNKNIKYNIEKTILEGFVKELVLEGYEDDSILEFVEDVQISQEQNIKPSIIQLENLKFEITEKTNPINVVLSKVNGCCQNIDGAASSAVYDGLSNPNSAFLAVFDIKKNKLVAMSWLRLGTDNILYLDNIEATESYSNSYVSDLFLEWSKQIKVKYEYKNVLAGTGYTKLEFPNNKKQRVNLDNLKNVDYTDLKNGAIILAKKKFNLKKISS